MSSALEDMGSVLWGFASGAFIISLFVPCHQGHANTTVLTAVFGAPSLSSFGEFLHEFLHLGPVNEVIGFRGEAGWSMVGGRDLGGVVPSTKDLGFVDLPVDVASAWCAKLGVAYPERVPFMLDWDAGCSAVRVGGC